MQRLIPNLFAIAILHSTAALGQEIAYRGPYFGEVLRVIDGDTFEARMELWPTISATVSIRLKGVDAPEIFRSQCIDEKINAEYSRDAMSGILPVGTKIRIENVEKDSFAGRVVADVWRQGEERGRTLTELLKRREAICPWLPGEEPIDWCGDTSQCWEE